MPPFTSSVVPPALNHFVIFSPALTPPLFKPKALPVSETSAPSGEAAGADAGSAPKDPGEGNKDLEDDLRDAAQILFYTSRQAGGVSRDRMLRQVGLVKGLMSFTGMVSRTPSDADVAEQREKNGMKHWCIHSHKARIIVLEVEEDFFIYANITLEQAAPPVTEGQVPKGKTDPTPTAQGLSDTMLVQAVERGYHDFRFQHGTFTSLLPPSPSLHGLIDKWWTRWAFSFESSYLSHSSPHPDLLNLWLGGYPSPASEVSESAGRAVEIYRDDADLPEAGLGVLNAAGPVALDGVIAEGPLLRFLMKHLIASLPPPVAAAVEGTPKGKKEPRKPSWATSTFGGLGEVMGNAVGWVPSLGSRPATPSIPPAPAPAAASGQSVGGSRAPSTKPACPQNIANQKKGWPGLGIGSAMGDAFGSMGSALGLGSSPKAREGIPVPFKTSSTPQEVAPAALPATDSPESAVSHSDELQEGEASKTEPPKDEIAVGSTPSTTSSHQVLQTSVVIPDLQAAAEEEHQVELHWEKRQVWLEKDEQMTSEDLHWIIRDDLLLFILGPIPSSPDRKATLALFSKLSSIPSTARPEPPNPGVIAPNYTVYHSSQTADVKGPPPDAATLSALADLKNIMCAPPGVVEVFGKAHNGKFLVAKRSRPSPGGEGSEMYMSLGRKDASLTDAEAAVRSFARFHPDLVG